MIKDIDILAREWADPYVAGDEDLGRLLGPGVPWERVVVLGDSIGLPHEGSRDWAIRHVRGGSGSAGPCI